MLKSTILAGFAGPVRDTGIRRMDGMVYGLMSVLVPCALQPGGVNPQGSRPDRRNTAGRGLAARAHMIRL